MFYLLQNILMQFEYSDREKKLDMLLRDDLRHIMFGSCTIWLQPFNI